MMNILAENLIKIKALKNSFQKNFLTLNTKNFS